MKYCNQCGTKNNLEAKFCHDCGVNLENFSIKTSVNANIKIATTSATTEKAFKAVGNSFSFTFILLKKLIKPVIILSVLAAIIFSLVFGGFFLYEEHLKKDKEKTIEEIKKKIISAQKDIKTNDKKWVIDGINDPASGKKIARYASALSNDGLCTMSVERRINGDELTSISCNKFRVYAGDDISVMYDTDKKLHTMNIEKFNNSDDVYIPSPQVKKVYNSYYERYDENHSYYFNYKKFVEGLLTANFIALKITPTLSHKYDDFENPFNYRYRGESTTLDPFWVRFTLKDAAVTIERLGKEISTSKIKN
ncbi:hypothetical protein [Desulfonauticus submarinus]